jgi:hypothetical protein
MRAWRLAPEGTVFVETIPNRGQICARDDEKLL